ncbi:MAG: hypothetical protein CL927_18150 [Deltaproteobacteria bacterium]|nr:hypothetical protein [Deltaproteobacteria bacterium]HCH61349.1 hypothetical protein [Deltaproteobacteria bacterium]
MLLTLFALLAGPVHAQDFFVEVGPVVELPTGGNWVRALPDEGGWMLGLATGVGYGLLPLKPTGDGPSDWTVEEAERNWQVQQDDLADHNLKRCPDGTWLHVATGQTTSTDDSAWWFRHDKRWNLIASGVVELDNAQRHHSDPSVMCSALGEGVLFGPRASDSGDAVFFEIGASGDAVVGPTVSKEPVPTGGALFTDVFTNEIHRLGVDGPAGNLVHVVYDQDWNELDRWMENPLPEPYFVYWPQGHMQLGDYWILGILGNTDRNGGGNDRRPFLVVYDRDWNAVAIEEVNAPGAGRPWIARRGSLLLMTFDNGLTPTLVGFELNLAAFGVDGADPDTGVNPEAFTGNPNGDSESGDSGTAAEDDKDGCGCASGGGGGLLAMLVGAIGAVRRRQSGHPE